MLEVIVPAVALLDELLQSPFDETTGDQTDAEAAATEELRAITPTNSDLLEIAARFPAPQEWYDEEGQGQ